MNKSNPRISRRKVLSKATAAGFSLGIVRSSDRLSPVQTAEANDNPLEYIKSFSDDDNEYHYTDKQGFDASIATNFGVVQDSIGAETNVCGEYMYEHHIAVWATGIYARVKEDEDKLISGPNINSQGSTIETSADFCSDSDDDGPLVYQGNRFFSLRGGWDRCPYGEETEAKQWFETDHYDDENYENYDDVEKWSNRWESDSESSKDDFDAWAAGLGGFGGVAGVLTAGTGPLGVAAFSLSAVSILDGLSELSQADGANIDDDNKRIYFNDSAIDSGVIGHITEFKVRVPAEQKCYVSVDMDIDVNSESGCYEHPLSENVDEDTCFTIDVPSNPEGGSPADADPIRAYKCSSDG